MEVSGTRWQSDRRSVDNAFEGANLVGISTRVLLSKEEIF